MDTERSSLRGGERAERQRQLAAVVSSRRRDLGLSVRTAADLAGVARGTWTALEQGDQLTSDSRFAGIERALRWQPGSVQRVLDGERPIPQPLQAQTDEAADEAITRVAKSNIPDTKKREIILLLIAERDAAERARIEHADQLIRLVRDQE